MDIKEYQSWKYITHTCLACGNFPETMNHFVSCTSYRNEPCKDWTNIYGSNILELKNKGIAVETTVEERKNITEKAEIGHSRPDSTAPGNC